MEISGVVIEGERYGREIGHPTANIDRKEYVERNLHVLQGIYGGFVVRADGDSFLAGIVVGPRDEAGLPRLEAHLIDFDGDLYGERITLHLLMYIRPFKQYSSVETLRAEIQKDLEVIKNADLCLPE